MKTPGINAEKLAGLNSTGAQAVKRRRRRVVASGTAPAAAVLGELVPGVSLVGVTNGQFSLIDMVEHCLAATGPADLAISTWTMGIYDQERAAAFYRNGLLRRVRFLVDPSIFGRKPELSGSLIERFGADAFRCVNTHAKFCTIENDHWSICIRSSMNLNPNKRMENFDLDDDAEICGFFRGIVDEVFERYTGEERSQSLEFFGSVLNKFENVKHEAGARWGVGAAGMFKGLKSLGDA